MNRNPIKLPPADSELVGLVELMCDGAISPAERDRLELLLENDRDAKLFYIAYLDLHAQMQWMMREDRAGEEGSEGVVSGQWLVASEEGAEEVAGGQWLVASEEGGGEVAGGQWSVASESDIQARNPEITKSPISNPLPTIILDDSMLPAPLSSLPFYISHPFVFSNLFALLVIGIGALGAWFYQVDIPHPVAESGRPSITKNRLSEAENIEFVGRVTGMVDVKWADINTSTETGNGVPLGRKYAMSSGLMEITYHTGAKVILQGPVTYEVDSRDGGFLSIGKLTAKLEKKPEIVASGQWLVASENNLPSPASGRGAGGEGGLQLETINQKSEIRNQKSLASSHQPESALTLTLSQRERGSVTNPQSEITKSQISNPQSPIPPSPAPRPQSPAPVFAVRTPTATVTDLGTEFGVEVDKKGATTSHVFRGSVVLQMVTAEGKAKSAAQVLRENESAIVEKQAGAQGLTVRRVSVDSAVFMRPEQLPKIIEEQNLAPFRRWQAYSQELRRNPSLLAYYDFQRRDESVAVLPNVAEIRRGSFDGIIENATWCRGRMIGKQALRFNGPDDQVRINLPQTVDDLTIASWVYVESLYYKLNGLLLSDGWGPGKLHWQVHTDGRLQLSINGLPDIPFYSKSTVFNRAKFRQWTHLVFVYDHSAASLAFYVNGQMIEKINISNPIPICIGSACLGHWNPDQGDMISDPTVRDFRGRIDEMAIFSRAMQPDLVRQMYRAGRPESNPPAGHDQKGGVSDIPTR